MGMLVSEGKLLSEACLELVVVRPFTVNITDRENQEVSFRFLPRGRLHKWIAINTQRGSGGQDDLQSRSSPRRHRSIDLLLRRRQHIRGLIVQSLVQRHLLWLMRPTIVPV